MTNSTQVTISNVPSGYDTTNSTENTDDDLTYVTYQVIYATYDSTTNVVSWHLTDWAKAALVDTSDTPASGTYTSEEAALAAISAMTGKTGSTGTTNPEQNTIVNTLAAYIASTANSTKATANSFESGTEWTGWSTATASGASSATSTATLEVGSYLVIASAADMSFLNMMVSVDVSSTPDGTGTGASTATDGWVLKAKDAVLKGNELTITKTVNDTGTASTYTESASAQVGDTVYYSVQVSVPHFAVNDSKHIFVVTDVANNLDIVENSITVTGYKTGNTTGTQLTKETSSESVTATAGYKASVSTSSDGNTDTLTVTFTDYYHNTNVFYTTSNGVTTYYYDYVIITYRATLRSSAIVVSESSSTGNSNTATMTYNYDNHSEESIADDATVYTYGLNLTKYNDKTGSDQTALSNATFKIYYFNAGNKTYLKFTGSNGSYAVSTTNDASEGVTTSSSGTLSLTGLDADKTYYLEETTAPSGYTLNTDTLAFQITDYTDATNLTYPNGTIDLLSLAEYSGTVSSDSKILVYAWTDASGGTNTIATNSDSSAEVDRTWTAARNSNTSADSNDTSYTGTFSTTVIDTKIAALPATGSIGIIVFTIAGVIIMILALVLINSGKSREKAGQGMKR
ncbi:MAG: LPXTG cell wall anchor domain-containing protein [Lachnospiraceae bacterium]|nr:LPXTG cell wall anchor domain-containing protein [Lachnospiraceae bacterium]